MTKEELLQTTDLFLLDLDGTVYLDETPIGEMRETLARLRACGKKLVYLTNNSSKTPDEYEKKLGRIGLWGEGDAVYTSAMAAIEYLSERHAGARVHVLATDAVRAQFARAIYESLALKYRWAIRRLERSILGEPIECLHIVGGGSNNDMLNRMTASAIGRPVLAGPGEGTAIGNLLMQAMALGAVESLEQLREVVRESFEVRSYQPQDCAQWDEAYGRFLSVTGLED